MRPGTLMAQGRCDPLPIFIYENLNLLCSSLVTIKQQVTLINSFMFIHDHFSVYLASYRWMLYVLPRLVLTSTVRYGEL